MKLNFYVDFKEGRLLRHFFGLILITLALGCQPFFVVKTWRVGEYSALREAEEASRSNDYDGAIEAYKRHIALRLQAENRPDWENPHFYLIIIGDIYLRQNRLAEALASYDQAATKGVDQLMVGDRYRALSTWYEKHGDLRQAMEILQKHRDIDPLLMDATLDRLAKSLSQHEEDSATKKPVSMSTPSEFDHPALDQPSLPLQHET